MCYKSNDDVMKDNEIQSWIRELNVSGFPGLSPEAREGLPTELTTIPQLADLVTKVSSLTTIPQPTDLVTKVS